MIDDIVYGIKVLLVIVSAVLIYASAKKPSTNYLFSVGCVPFGFCLFITGVEMITSHEAPWEFLISQGTEQEWSKAFMGGVLMLMLPILLLAVCGKDLAQLMESKSE